MKNLIKSVTSCVALLASQLTNMHAMADEALYGAPPPADAVFVRWLCDGDMAAPTRTVSGFDVQSDHAANAAYVPISAALLGNDVTAGQYYSVIPKSGASVLIAEPARQDKSKVHLFLMSANPTPVNLIVPGKNIEVIAPKEFGQVGTRAVNPISTPLAVNNAVTGASLLTVNGTLKRGQNVTFVHCPAGVEMIENTVSEHVYQG